MNTQIKIISYMYVDKVSPLDYHIIDVSVIQNRGI
jgi:hypothetical protein